MFRNRIALLLLLPLAGCYTVNQPRFEAYAAKRVKVGMPMSESIRNLVSDGFKCDAKSAAPAVTCTRMRDSILPYSCIERINIRKTADVVSAVEVPSIACAGL